MYRGSLVAPLATISMNNRTWEVRSNNEEAEKRSHHRSQDQVNQPSRPAPPSSPILRQDCCSAHNPNPDQVGSSRPMEGRLQRTVVIISRINELCRVKSESTPAEQPRQLLLASLTCQSRFNRATEDQPL